MEGAQNSITINLGQKKKPSVTNAFYSWAINGGKVLIILTELVALGALSFRFYIDRRIIDLNDEIKKQELFVSGKSAQEKTFRNLQSRIGQIKTTSDDARAKVALVNKVIEQINIGSFTSTNLIVNQNAINISGIAFSVFQLNSFIETLKEEEGITAISVDEITSSEKGISFKINIALESEPTGKVVEKNEETEE